MSRSEFPSLEEDILGGIAQAVAAAYPGVALPGGSRILRKPPAREHGDYAFACFPLAPAVQEKPAQIAEKLAAHLPKLRAVRGHAVAGPYLNFFVDRGQLIAGTCAEVLAAGARYGHSTALDGERIMVEFSSPNTNKPQHLGHVRNNVLGDAVSNLLAACGARVVRANLVNDRGVHICQTMLAYQKWAHGVEPAWVGKKGDHFVGDLYVWYQQVLEWEFAAWLHARGFDTTSLAVDAREKEKETFLRNHSVLNAEAQDLLRRWEAGDADVHTLWRRMNEWVMDGFRATYAALGVAFDRFYFESETYQLGKDIVERGLADGVFVRTDKGVVLDLTEEKLGTKVFLRPDGTSVYITQDLGTAVMKASDYGLTQSVYVVAREQEYHFRILFDALRRLGYPWAKGLHHLSYGMVHLPEGRMKSRAGKVVEADDLMKNLKHLAAEEIHRRVPGDGDEDEEGPDEDETRVLARQIGLGALKFHMLLPSSRNDMTFDPKKSIDFEGKTGPYVQYACVRITSILAKAGGDMGDAEGASALATDAELEVAQALREYPGVVAAAALRYEPSTLVNYLFETAQAFNTFYRDHPVLQAETATVRAGRLALCRATAQVLRNGLQLLGIEVPARM